jgi:hypothetical protein
MGRLVKIGFPCHTVIVCPGSGAYVRRVTTSHTSGSTPYVLCMGSLGEPHFLYIVRLFFDS